MIRKILGIAFCFITITNQAGAQALGIELNGGLQGMQYQLQNGQSKLLPGGSLGVNYTFRLGSKWGLLTGISGGLYRTEATLQDGNVFTSGQVDDAGSAFQYNMKTIGYKETQQFYSAGIPLLLQYHSAGTGTQWYFDIGGKVLIPFSNSIQISAQQLSVSGYYPDFNLDVSNLPQHGFGTLDGWKGSSSSQLKTVAALSAASGLSFLLSTHTRLYTGLFVDYGLTDLKDENSSLPLITYSSTGINGIQANSVMNTKSASNVTLLSFGLQVRISFVSAKVKPVSGPKTKKELQHPVDSTLNDHEAEGMQRSIVFGLIGEATIPEIEKKQLNEMAEFMKEQPEIRISVVGHTCNNGTETEDIKVGKARAKAVAHYLRSKGIKGNRMDVSYDSERDPDLMYDPSAGSGANYRSRRVVITVE